MADETISGGSARSAHFPISFGLRLSPQSAVRESAASGVGGVTDGEILDSDDKPPDARQHRYLRGETPAPLEMTSTNVFCRAVPTAPTVWECLSAETVAGTTAGIVGKVVEHPLDTVKTRLQESHPCYSNPHSAFCSIVRAEGGASLYRGLSAPLLAAALEQGATFTLFSNALVTIDRLSLVGSVAPIPLVADAEELSGALHSWRSQSDKPEDGGLAYSSERRAAAPLAHHAVAGAGTGILCATFVTPVEYLKCRMQQCRTHRMTLRELLRGGGWRNVYSGHTATLARDGPGTAAWFVGYECTLRAFRWWDRRSFQNSTDEVNANIAAATTTHGKCPFEDPSPGRIAVAGGFAGVMFATAFFPADVVKTRMQLDPEFCRRGLAAGLSRVVREEGLRALYKGWSCTAISAIPANAAIFLTYEGVIQWLGGASS